QISYAACRSLENEIQIVQTSRTGYGTGHSLPGLPATGVRDRDGTEERPGRAVEQELQGAAVCARNAHTDVGEARREVHVLVHSVSSAIGIANVVTAQRVARRLSLE